MKHFLTNTHPKSQILNSVDTCGWGQTRGKNRGKRGFSRQKVDRHLKPPQLVAGGFHFGVQAREECEGCCTFRGYPGLGVCGVVRLLYGCRALRFLARHMFEFNQCEEKKILILIHNVLGVKLSCVIQNYTYITENYYLE